MPVPGFPAVLECVLNGLLSDSELGSYKLDVHRDITTVELRFYPKSAMLCVVPPVPPVSSVQNFPSVNKRQKTPSRQRRDERRWNHYRNRTVWSSNYRKSECSVPGTGYDISSVGRTTTSTTRDSAIASSYTPNVAHTAMDDSDGIIIAENTASDGPTHSSTPINVRGKETQSADDGPTHSSTPSNMYEEDEDGVSVDKEKLETHPTDTHTNLLIDNERVTDVVTRVTATTKKHNKRYGTRKRVTSTHSDSDVSTGDDMCDYKHDDGPDNNDGSLSTEDELFNIPATPCPADDDTTNPSTNQPYLQLGGHGSGDDDDHLNTEIEHQASGGEMERSTIQNNSTDDEQPQYKERPAKHSDDKILEEVRTVPDGEGPFHEFLLDWEKLRHRLDVLDERMHRCVFDKYK